jgi:hypothetical protein
MFREEDTGKGLPRWDGELGKFAGDLIRAKDADTRLGDLYVGEGFKDTCLQTGHGWVSETVSENRSSWFARGLGWCLEMSS